MARVDPLQAAAAAYAAERWDDPEVWRQFGRETGTSDIITSHPRLLRSLSFGDDDYPDAALVVIGQLLNEAIEEGSGEAGRMDLIADAMPDLPEWIASGAAPARTKRLFEHYVAARDASEIPAVWRHGGTDAGVQLNDDVSSLTPPSAEEFWGMADKSTQPAPEPVASSPQPQPSADPGVATRDRSIFIVHGHDQAALDSIRVYVHRVTGTMPISLAEEPGRGKTIIEKFEDFGANASFVIVLLTPDDVGQTLADHDAGGTPNPRARQNVVLELGYFIGKIGREKIVVINADVERPSDLAGLSYITYPAGNWKDALRSELAAVSLAV